jgi:RimJ/RimL family protein N-acetyltransferase
MLIGKNIKLRPLKISDIEKSHEWRNNIELIKMTQGIRFPKTFEMDREWFEYALNDKSNRNIYFGIDRLDNDEFIGIIQLSNIDYISGTATWGFIIGDEKNRGNGISIEAPCLLFDYAFKILNLKKLLGYTISLNKATFFMQLAIGGFKHEGTLKNQVFFDDNYHDVLIFSLFKENYMKKVNKEK